MDPHVEPLVKAVEACRRLIIVGLRTSSAKPIVIFAAREGRPRGYKKVEDQLIAVVDIGIPKVKISSNSTFGLSSGIVRTHSSSLPPVGVFPCSGRFASLRHVRNSSEFVRRVSIIRST